MKKILLFVSLILLPYASPGQNYSIVSLAPRDNSAVYLDADGAGTVSIELDISQIPPRNQVTRFEVIPVSVTNGQLSDWYAGSDISFRQHSSSSPMTMFRYVADIEMEFRRNASIEAKTCKFNFEIKGFSATSQVFTASLV